MSPTHLHCGSGGGQLHPDEEGPQDLPLPAQVAITLTQNPPLKSADKKTKNSGIKPQLEPSVIPVVRFVNLFSRLAYSYLVFSHV